MMMAGRLSGGASAFVAINATAISDYVRPLDAQGKPRPESYVFTAGKFFGGRTADTSIGQLKFEEISKSLALPLAKQNYFPTKEVRTANLLLMVHWGTTQIFEDPHRERSLERMNEALSEYRDVAAAGDGNNADSGALNAAIGEQNNAAASAAGMIARNAKLLGYKATLEREQRKLFASTEEQTMNAELNEERYFIIVMAYDYQLLLKEKKSRLLWITRISVRSPGNNFAEAIPVLARAGSEVYGRHVDGLVRIQAGKGDGRVDLGELKTLGAVENVPPAGAAK